MYALIHCATIVGIQGKRIAVEVDITNGLPQLTIVGLPDPAIREAVDRVRAAIKNSRFQFPLGRITVNLAPASIRKEGTSFDLAIAIGILIASNQITATLLTQTLVIGELSLDGSIQPLPGVLAMIEEARDVKLPQVLLPIANMQEATCLSGIRYIGLQHLQQLHQLDHLLQQTIDTPTLASISDNVYTPALEDDQTADYSDYSEVIGQQAALRAMMIAAIGKHNVLLSGPPGSGKTMIVKKLPSILPPLDEEESLAVTKIYSISGKLPTQMNSLLTIPPFRAPHHSISAAGLMGGGTIPKPGEITLAHHGVLFLDELLEFPRAVLEMLRQPLEDRHIVISRAKLTATFPASFLLLASYNPCPCGFFHQSAYKDQICTCTANQINRYLSKLSGPLRDRFDLALHIARPTDIHERSQTNLALSSTDMRMIVWRSRQFSIDRNRLVNVKYNSELRGTALHKVATLQPSARSLLMHAVDHYQLSMRSYERIIKVARTIADIEQTLHVEEQHIAEAMYYRQLQH